MIVLDTHVLVWWVSGSKDISAHALRLIDDEKNNGKLLVSAISVCEIYMLVQKGRLQFDRDVDSWIQQVCQLPFLEIVPVDVRIAGKAVVLPGEFHSDPADRMIVATAREHGLQLVTADERIQKYAFVETVW